MGATRAQLGYRCAVKRAVGIVVLVLVANGCRREQKQPAEVNAQEALEPRGLYISNAGETDARVKKAFPNGVASEDARPQIGTAPPPPDDRAPDPRSDIVVEIESPSPVDLAAVLAAVKPRPEGILTFIKGMTADGEWQYVEDQNATGPYKRVAAQITFTDVDAPASQDHVERQIAWARAALGKLSKRPATVSMTSAEAFARATAAFDLKRTLTDEAIDVGVVVAAPKGKKLA